MRKGTYRRLALSVAALLTAVSAAAASAAMPRPYLLRHPAHARCRTHYVRKIKVARVHFRRIRHVWCVYRAPAKARAPSTPPPSGKAPTYTSVTPSYIPYPSSLAVTGTIVYGNGTQLLGLPITYTIVDTTAGRTLASFAATAGPDGICSFTISLYDNAFHFTGEAVLQYHGCAVGAFTAPANDALVISGSFAGNEQYAPSDSTAEPFP